MSIIVIGIDLAKSVFADAAAIAEAVTPVPDALCFPLPNPLPLAGEGATSPPSHAVTSVACAARNAPPRA